MSVLLRFDPARRQEVPHVLDSVLPEFRLRVRAMQAQDRSSEHETDLRVRALVLVRAERPQQ